MFAILSGFIGIFIAIALLAFVYYRPPLALKEMSTRLHRLAAILSPLGLWPKFKQVRRPCDNRRRLHPRHDHTPGIEKQDGLS